MNERILEAAYTLIKACKDNNAGVMKIVMRDKAGNPTAAAIAVFGAEESDTVVKAVEAIEEFWQQDTE